MPVEIHDELSVKLPTRLSVSGSQSALILTQLAGHLNVPSALRTSNTASTVDVCHMGHPLKHDRSNLDIISI